MVDLSIVMGQFARGLTSIFLWVFLWFSHVFPFSHGFPMVFQVEHLDFPTRRRTGLDPTFRRTRHPRQVDLRGVLWVQLGELKRLTGRWKHQKIEIFSYGIIMIIVILYSEDESLVGIMMIIIIYNNYSLDLTTMVINHIMIIVINNG